MELLVAAIVGGDKMSRFLGEIARKLTGGQPQLRVGFLEDATYPDKDNTPVAMIAAIQNFGAPSVGIPPRPFFSNMVRDKSPGWPEAIVKNIKRTRYDVQQTLRLVGEGIRGQLQQSIRDTNSPPLAESTLEGRGVGGMVYNPKDKKTFGAKPLIATGHMINSVDFEVKT